ncbi:C-3 sterol dehydrogenase/C-4 decarboxylase [Diaporthe sp. PMI_573]|jgi:sterol-4alpha-carboxylate 3-dehydrogenase (decarboxylating)|nr:C-3 sterol dehydrogenase/C-4 decarboxylase [Diaporthaceae sp. PMI_573]
MPPKYGTPSTTPPAPPPTQRLGTVLVTGGCGFLGFYLVGKLITDPDCGTVCILDKDVTRNLHDSPGAQYISCDITDASAVATILDRMRPEVIFHSASPNATYGRRDGFWRGQFYRTNVTGTETLIRLAKERPFIKAFVYTSSNAVYTADEHVRIRESAPTYNARPWPWKGALEYAWTKGVAHNLVLDSNESWRKGGLKTCAIVPANIYGVRDGQALSLMFDTFADHSKPIFKVGKGENMASFVEVGNCADLHILAAKGLIEGRPGVGGEAFNATDGNDVPLWWHMGVICAAIRGTEDSPSKLRVRIIPAWVMCISVYVVWWVLLIFTLGYMEPPPAFSVEGYSWCTKDHTYDIRKARRALGYEPNSDSEWHEEVVQEAVEFEKERRREARMQEQAETKSEGGEKLKTK